MYYIYIYMFNSLSAGLNYISVGVFSVLCDHELSIVSNYLGMFKKTKRWSEFRPQEQISKVRRTEYPITSDEGKFLRMYKFKWYMYI